MAFYDYCLLTGKIIFFLIFIIFLILLYIYSIRKVRHISKMSNEIKIDKQVIYKDKYCPNCGTLINSNYCPVCGRKNT